MEFEASSGDPPLPALILIAASKKEVKVKWGDKNCLTVNSVTFTTISSITRYLAHLEPGTGWFGKNPMEDCQVNHWVTYSFAGMSQGALDECLAYLDAALAPTTYLVGHKCTLADIAVWSKLRSYPEWAQLLAQNRAPLNLVRWYSLINSLSFVVAALSRIPENVAVTLKPEGDSGRKEEGKFVELPGAEMGKVVVRFPPEASGYLHIGHAKAALLNQHYKDSFGGKLIMRFDDTNPAKEKVDFEKVILEDLKMLNVRYDQLTHTSNYFDMMIEMCEKMLKSGLAYVDDTDPEVMKTEREQKIESKNRGNAVAKNLEMWAEMKKGTEYGQKCCVRAKIDMSSLNGCMRDPTIYRCKNELHPRTGSKYKVYPTYDFACPIVDSVEGVTHCLRTTEYHDRDDQFYWFIDALGLRKPYIWEYSRLNMTNTVLSKRKLTWFVENGLVEGWDDPRMPTVRGVLRRGMTVKGLKQFIVAQGSSRSVVVMEWDKIWAINKKVIDPIAPRYTVVDSTYTRVTISNVSEGSITAAKHPKNAQVGDKTVWVGPHILVDEADAKLFKEGDNVTFINWGNIRIDKIIKRGGVIFEIVASPNLEDKNYKKTMKITWLAQTSRAPLIPCVCVYFDHLISKAILGKDEDFKQYIGKNTKTEVQMIGDPELASVQKNEIIQLQRKGFFVCDRPYSSADIYSGLTSPIVLFAIPDGHTKEMPTSGIRAAQQAQGTQPQEAPPATAVPVKEDAATLNSKITTQGNKIRELKEGKADKNVIKEEVKILLALKNDYKTVTGTEWAPGSAPAPKTGTRTVAEVTAQVEAQGNAVRQLKSSNAPKDQINEAVQKLLALKQDYKNLTGNDFPAPKGKPEPKASSDAVTALVALIEAQGDLVRMIKRTGSKDEINEAVQKLLNLKQEYKTSTGTEFPSGGRPGGAKPKEKPKETPKPKEKPKPKEDSGVKKVTRLGLEATKEENLPDWYSQVITKGEMIEYYDVSGCYILRPWAFGIWEAIQDWLDKRIKGFGVKNCYFPIFVSKAALEREKTHIADFAPEVAWVTKSGDSDLAEPIAVRPTSETIMYPAFAKWIQSHRDLPVKLNQWNNVVRWEFKHPQPFLRTREFLWQEGHTAYGVQKDAEKEVLDILDLYAGVYTELLAIPVVKGRKTEKEKFAGGDYTTTVEAYVSASGRAIQGATSHHLGQNFSKMFDIVFEDPETQEKKFVYQNSWGLTTRTIGVMVMVHADNQGLVLPPRVASVQIIIVPCGITASLPEPDKQNLIKACSDLESRLVKAGIRAESDLRDNYSPGWKFNHWELKGVPIRVEIGPKDLQQKQIVTVRRDTGEKKSFPLDSAVNDLSTHLDLIQANLLAKATSELNSHMVVCKSWPAFCENLDNKNIIQAPFCGQIPCEDKIKEDSARTDPEADSGAPSMGAKSLCIPFEPLAKLETNDKCIHPDCKSKPQFYTLFGRSY